MHEIIASLVCMAAKCGSLFLNETNIKINVKSSTGKLFTDATPASAVVSKLF